MAAVTLPKNVRFRHYLHPPPPKVMGIFGIDKKAEQSHSVLLNNGSRWGLVLKRKKNKQTKIIT